MAQLTRFTAAAIPAVLTLVRSRGVLMPTGNPPPLCSRLHLCLYIDRRCPCAEIQQQSNGRKAKVLTKFEFIPARFYS
jgi:hypothetical protein